MSVRSSSKFKDSRIPGKSFTTRVLPHGYYEVITSAGILKDKYTIENLGLYNGVIETSENLNRRGVATKISLREAAIAFNNHEKNAKIKTKKANDPNVFASKKKGTISCGCKSSKGCHEDSRCKCWAAKQRCNSHCHLNGGKNLCKNA